MEEPSVTLVWHMTSMVLSSGQENSKTNVSFKKIFEGTVNSEEKNLVQEGSHSTLDSEHGRRH
jgi:hypothetical protein